MTARSIIFSFTTLKMKVLAGPCDLKQVSIISFQFLSLGLVMSVA